MPRKKKPAKPQAVDIGEIVNLNIVPSTPDGDIPLSTATTRELEDEEEEKEWDEEEDEDESEEEEEAEEEEDSEDVSSPSRRFIYTLEFHTIKCKDCEEKVTLYGYHFNKHIGDNLGETSPADTVEEMLTALKHIIGQWKKFDSILGRYVDPPDEKNTEVIILDSVPITEGQVWATVKEATQGQKGLSAFF